MPKRGGYLGGGTVIKVYPRAATRVRKRLGALDDAIANFDPNNMKTEVVKAEDAKPKKKRSTRKRTSSKPKTKRIGANAVMFLEADENTLARRRRKLEKNRMKETKKNADE